jgi:hypothetical protein
MQQLDGVVTIVQESRFQLLDNDGVSHQFLLGYGAAVEPEQLPSLLERRIRVAYTDPKDLIGHRAARIVLLDGA